MALTMSNETTSKRRVSSDYRISERARFGCWGVESGVPSVPASDLASVPASGFESAWESVPESGVESGVASVPSSGVASVPASAWE
jgi:hypothetical protein